MIYFSNGHQSLVANGGYFFWKIEGESVFFHEDMVELQNKTGYIFKERKWRPQRKIGYTSMSSEDTTTLDINYFMMVNG